MEKELSLSGYWRGQSHYLPIRIYIADTDCGGVVYHARYLEYMERARAEALRLRGLQELMEKEKQAGAAQSGGFFLPVTELKIAFKTFARLDDLLLVQTETEKLTGARFYFRQRFWRGETLLAEANCCIALVNKDGRPQRIPDSWRARFADFA